MRYLLEVSKFVWLKVLFGFEVWPAVSKVKKLPEVTHDAHTHTEQNKFGASARILEKVEKGCESLCEQPPKLFP